MCLFLKTGKSSCSGFTYQLDFSYNGGAKLEQAQAFRKFVETSLDSGSDPDKLNLLLEIIGICISSVMIARKFYFFVGATKSGKSVIADLIQSVVFPETSVTAFGLNQLGARFNTQHLEYSRINICRELTAGKLTGTDILKMLVSDEPLFIEERCQMSGEVHISVFIEVYKKFCTENALVPYKNNEVSAYIANCFPAVRKEKFRIDGKYLWGWRGISLSAYDAINNKEEK